tara:strand:- start:10662 stop:10889 length:228 start_codon:yes stop_codon:yes gene_type:complete
MAKINHMGEILCESCADKNGLIPTPQDSTPATTEETSVLPLREADGVPVCVDVNPGQPVTAGGVLGCDDCGMPLD